MSSIVDGAVYRITNVKVPDSSLELEGGSNENGTTAQIWKTNRNSANYYNQVWVVQRRRDPAVPRLEDPYSLCNLRSGTYLDLKGGSRERGTKLQGFQWGVDDKEENNENRLFWLNCKGNNTFVIENLASGTVVDLQHGNSSNGADVKGYDLEEGNKNQLWVFQRLSLSVPEITTALEGMQITQNTGVDHIMDSKQYLCLPRGVINAIYANTRLATTAWRSQIFDCDDFAFAMKSAVAQSVNSWPVRANGFALLGGFICAKKPDSAHAFNWFYLHGDDEPDGKARLEFFEPQSGKWSVDGFGYTTGFLVIY